MRGCGWRRAACSAAPSQPTDRDCNFKRELAGRAVCEAGRAGGGVGVRALLLGGIGMGGKALHPQFICGVRLHLSSSDLKSPLSRNICTARSSNSSQDSVFRLPRRPSEMGETCRIVNRRKRSQQSPARKSRPSPLGLSISASVKTKLGRDANYGDWVCWSGQRTQPSKIGPLFGVALTFAEMLMNRKFTCACQG